MIEWIHVLLAAGSFTILAVFVIVLIHRCLRSKRREQIRRTTRAESIQDGMLKLQQGISQHQQQDQSKRRGNYNVFRRGVSTKSLFSWSDHPSLITDAVENGWSRFGFTNYTTSPSTRASFLRLCAVGDYVKEPETEITWEVSQGSADFMQKIRLNSGLKNINSLNSTDKDSLSAVSVIRTSLPLPGPPLGNSAFPQEAYFEITIVYSSTNEQESVSCKEGEKTKLIQENCKAAKVNSEVLVNVDGSHRVNNIEEIKLTVRDDHDCSIDMVMLSLGLTVGGSLSSKLPGTYSGSVGFCCNGSVLDGVKIVAESEKSEWARKDKVIGCGYDPRQKKVFFTVDSELVHVIQCKSDEFGTPLYPIIAANIDVTVLVNFGQSVFSYAPANAHRTANPCFIGPLANSPALGYEDSKELFSMGRIDSQWLNRSGTRGGSRNTNGGNSKDDDFDEESEADLFEIVLDGNSNGYGIGVGVGRSPSVVL